MAAAHTSYTVRAGDTLSKIAKRQYGSSKDWQALWWVNKAKIRNPNLIRAGQTIRLSRWHPDPPRWLAHAASRAIPRPRVVLVSSSVGGSEASSNGSAPSVGSTVVQPFGGSFQQCVITRESGGQSQVMNSSGHYGLYQFDEGTWISGGGAAADFGHASVAEQNQVFAAVYAARGVGPWRPYDGC